MTKKEVHILIGCADARDLNQYQIDAVSHTIKAFAARGIEVEMHIIRAAGSFVTPDVVADVKRIVEEEQRTTRLPLTFFVHIQSHGHMTKDSNTEYISHVYDLQVVDDSPLNCGMLGATAVAIELEQFLIEKKLEVCMKGKEFVVDSDAAIQTLLLEVYAHEGYLAGDWIKSIDKLRVHPRTQRTVLENAIKADPDLRTQGIQITAGIQDYSIHSLIRVDGGIPAVEFWDQIQYNVRCSVSLQRGDHQEVIKQSEKQKPLAGLLCLTDPKTTSRTLAARYYSNLKGLEETESYLPNTIFNITGSAFDLPNTPFGPYVIAGFFYGVKHLHLTDQIVMGYNQAQTDRMLQKIAADPIMNLIVKEFNVNLIPLNHVDVARNAEVVA
jgi:hypothetical protein